MLVRNKRINADGRAVFDVYSDDGRNFKATVQLRGEAPGQMDVMLGALQPRGKELTLEAIRRYELIA